MIISAPEKLRIDHDLSAFGCGVSALDSWLRRELCKVVGMAHRARPLSARRWQVVGYYALAAGSR